MIQATKQEKMDFQKQRVRSCLLNFTNTDEIAQEQSHAQSKGHEYVRQLIFL